SSILTVLGSSAAFKLDEPRTRPIPTQARRAKVEEERMEYLVRTCAILAGPCGRPSSRRLGYDVALPGRSRRMSVRPLILAACLVASTAGAQTPSPTPQPQLTVIKAARLFDGKGDATITGAVVVIEGSTIKAAGAGLSVPPGAEVIDLGDATLLPGFIDAHVHLTGESGDNWYKDAIEGLRRNLPETAIRATELARKTLMAGFTTVRNVGASDFVDVGLR